MERCRWRVECTSVWGVHIPMVYPWVTFELSFSSLKVIRTIYKVTLEERRGLGGKECLLYKHKDLVRIPSTHVESWPWVCESVT